MSWQLGAISVLALVLAAGGLWFERSRPSARILAAVAALAALGVAGRVLLAPLPNVVATTDVVLLAGYALGGAPGFAVGALSALVSNFWLGQGPWTPWQMAGWGMVGIGGAALAVATGRRLGRVGLAVAAGFAGLAYGALLDLSAMVNFGGEQSLDRYLALSARGIPFNVAHALGNAALMLAAGPALVRMLGRYRERFEVHWREASPAAPAVLALLVATAIALPVLGTSESANAGGGAGDARSWLVGAQNKDGGYGTSPGSSSSPGMTGWAMLGLEAAGRNPIDVRSGGRSPVDYLRANVGDLDSTGDLERTILALRGAGLPVRLGGRDLAAELRSRQGGNGSYEKQVNLTAFAILARSAAGEGAGSLRKAAGWLKGAQNRDGGWGSAPGAASEPDSTGAALQALGRAGAEKASRAGVKWLRGAQHGDGGWSLTSGADSNSQSTSWALQGLLAAGADPSGVRKRSRNGFEYLGSRSASDGHYAYSKSSDQTPVWVTAQALTGIERAPFPIAPVARSSGGGGGGGGGSSSGGGAGPGSRSGLGGSGPGVSSSAGSGSAGPGAGGSGAAGQADIDAALKAPDVTALPAAETAALPIDEAAESGGLPLLAILGGVNLLGGLTLAGWLYYRARFQ